MPIYKEIHACINPLYTTQSLKNTIVEMGAKLLKQMMMLVMLLFIQGAYAQIITKLPGCQERCGSLVVRYPFGIGPNCSAHERMEIYCNTSFNPPKAFSFGLHSYRIPNSTAEMLQQQVQYMKDLEVLNISLEAGTIHINYPISTDCTNTTSYTPTVIVRTPFKFSNTENRFTAMGCDNLALLRSGSDSQKSIKLNMEESTVGVGGCVSRCDQSLKKDNTCFGIDCCQTRFPPSLWAVRALSSSVRSVGNDNSSLGCSQGPRYAFIVDQSWFENLEDIDTVKSRETVPAVLNWRTFGACRSFFREGPFPTSTLCGVNALCTNQSLCSCRKGYEGNPYLRDGCQDIDECATNTDNKCEQICTNTPGSYNCSCKDGWELVGHFQCVKKEVDHSVKKAAIIVTAACAGLGVLLTATWWLYKVIRRRNTRKLEEKFFKRNGGLLLRQQVSSSQGHVETTKLFTSKELEKATDRYNIDRIVGQGGQGTVYKGMLTDGRIVAVKKSKIEDESKLEHFINEVVILSQINHRNVVKLHGCCLQTEVPLLVYEFIPNGTLMQYIHEDNEYFPLTWDVRLRVATEVAGALYYLHSAASIPIYHRDIKSTNILLDDKYRAKVADFGTSRSFSIDQTHQTTRVQGTFGYLDPEYFRSSQFTDKSDVYSFGVVLAELLTGQKPILAARLDDEARGLATLFSLAMEENRMLDILDSRISDEGKKEEMITFANIAYRCLNLNGRRRPTMKQVVAELESIRNTNGSTSAQQHYEDIEYGIDKLNEPWESDFTSTSTSSTVYHSLNVDIEPLMTN